MASIKTSSRYSSFDSRSSTSSHMSDPSSSAELKNPSKYQSSIKRLVGSSSSRHRSPGFAPAENSSRTLVKAKSSDLAPAKIKNEQNFTSMMKKFMENRSKPKTAANPIALVIPADFIAEDLKKKAKKGSNFSALPRKLFQKGSSAKDRNEMKALTEVKSNTRTLAMVLRSERELLNQNKEYETEITELTLRLEEKNREVEKLKDLCLKQREEIKALKSAILFPEVMNSQLQDILEQQGSELKQAKQVIPTLQRQVTSLRGQLQCLVEDLAEVKADKYAVRGCFEGNISSPKTPANEQEAANSLEYSSGETTIPGSPDDMLLKDFNPCLTPYYVKTKSKEFEEKMDHNYADDDPLFGRSAKLCQENPLSSQGRGLSKSSDCCPRSSLGGASFRAAHWSNE